MKRLGYKDVLISFAELIELSCNNLTEKSLSANCSRSNSKENSASWLSEADPADGRRILIKYTSIPKQTMLKYNLPDVSVLIDRIKAEKAIEAECQQQQQIEFKETQLQECVNHALNEEYVKYCPKYDKIYPGKRDKVILYAKTHSVLLCLADLRSGYSRDELHTVYLKTPGIKITLNNLTKFGEKLKEIAKGEVKIVHKHANTPREHLVKLTDWHKATITKYYMDGNQFSHRTISELLYAECLKKVHKTVSFDTVSKYLSQPAVKNRLAVYRNPDYFKRTVKPHTRRKKARYAGDLYYGDGSPIQILCKNQTGDKLIKLNVFLIMDVMSGKVVGYDFAETEDRFNWFSAFKMAFAKEQLLPYELMCDQGPVIKTAEYKALKERLEVKGCRLNTTSKGEPQQKGNIERLIGTLQTTCQNMIDGYIGEGIRSKRENGRIDTKHIANIHKEKGVYNYETLVTIMVELISIYNNKPYDNKLAPFDAYRESEKPNTANINDADLAVLFWHSKKIKIAKSEVKFDIKKITYIYDLYSHQLGLKYNNEQVTVYYDENDLQSVHLFTLTGEYICECRQKVEIVQAKANQTQLDVLDIIKQSSHNEAMTRTAKRLTDELLRKGAENDEDFAEVLDPFLINKELYNNAETQKDLNYIYQQKDIDTTKVVTYEPMASKIKITNSKEKITAQERHSKKNIVTGSLAIVGRVSHRDI